MKFYKRYSLLNTSKPDDTLGFFEDENQKYATYKSPTPKIESIKQEDKKENIKPDNDVSNMIPSSYTQYISYEKTKPVSKQKPTPKPKPEPKPKEPEIIHIPIEFTQDDKSHEIINPIHFSQPKPVSKPKSTPKSTPKPKPKPTQPVEPFRPPEIMDETPWKTKPAELIHPLKPEESEIIPIPEPTEPITEPEKNNGLNEIQIGTFEEKPKIIPDDFIYPLYQQPIQLPKTATSNNSFLIILSIGILGAILFLTIK